MELTPDKSRSVRIRLLLETVAIIAGCEGTIMLLLPLIMPAGSGGWVEGMVDTALLTLSSGPLLYWRFKTYHQAQKTFLLAELGQRTAALTEINRALANQKFALDQHSIVAITDVQGRITYANDRFCAISGYTREEVLGRNHRILKSGMHPPELYREMWATISHGRVWRGEVCNRTKTGQFYWVDATIAPLLGPDGKPDSYIAIRTDITTRKHAEAELQRAKNAADEASRAKSEFLATMSHEIRTPMNGVIGFTDLLLETTLTGSQRRYVEMLRTSGENLLILINDILDFSKIESGKLVLEDLPCDVRRCADDVLGLLDSQAAKKNLTLELDFAADVPRWLMGDPVRLRQIMLNFVGNALKFTAEGGVRLEGRMESGALGPELWIGVVDSGIGISPAQQLQLFQKFSQADASTTRKFGGTGLGLAICRSLVEAMGGQIGVISAEGEGSTFWFTMPARIASELPLELVAAPSVGKTTPANSSVPNDASIADAAESTSSALCMLVVDDSEINLLLATSFIHSLGFQTETAANGRIAVEMAGQKRYAAILMDYHMPVLDGCNATVEIRTGAGLNRHTPIIGLSASVEDREHCLLIGMNDYLSKPVRKTDLKRALLGALHRTAKAAGDGECIAVASAR